MRLLFWAVCKEPQCGRERCASLGEKYSRAEKYCEFAIYADAANSWEAGVAGASRRTSALFPRLAALDIVHVGGEDIAGVLFQKMRFRRDTHISLFEVAKPAVVAMRGESRLAVDSAQAGENWTQSTDQPRSVRDALCEVDQQKDP